MAVLLDRTSGVDNTGVLMPKGPTGSDNGQRAEDALKERNKLGSALRSKRLQPFIGTKVHHIEVPRGLPDAEIVFPRRPEHFPKAMELFQGEGEIFDFNYVTYGRGGTIVSRQFQEVVERHEPAGTGFQFHLVPIYAPNGDLLSDNHLFWDVYRRVDATDPTSPKLRVVHQPDIAFGNHRWSVAPDRRSNFTEPLQDIRRIFREKVAGMAAWCDIRVDAEDQPIFVTDALFDDLIAAGLTGFLAHTRWAET